MTLKEIVTLPAEAKFVHAIAGTLYYRITTDDVVVEFPIDMKWCGHNYLRGFL